MNCGKLVNSDLQGFDQSILVLFVTNLGYLCLVDRETNIMRKEIDLSNSDDRESEEIFQRKYSA